MKKTATGILNTVLTFGAFAVGVAMVSVSAVALSERLPMARPWAWFGIVAGCVGVGVALFRAFCGADENNA